jgi:hypothetical protein
VIFSMVKNTRLTAHNVEIEFKTNVCNFFSHIYVIVLVDNFFQKLMVSNVELLVVLYRTLSENIK